MCSCLEVRFRSVHAGRSVTYVPGERETVQGFDYTFGTNVLGT